MLINSESKKGKQNLKLLNWTKKIELLGIIYIFHKGQKNYKNDVNEKKIIFFFYFNLELTIRDFDCIIHITRLLNSITLLQKKKIKIFVIIHKTIILIRVKKKIISKKKKEIADVKKFQIYELWTSWIFNC